MKIFVKSFIVESVNDAEIKAAKNTFLNFEQNKVV